MGRKHGVGKFDYTNTKSDFQASKIYKVRRGDQGIFTTKDPHSTDEILCYITTTDPYTFYDYKTNKPCQFPQDYIIKKEVK